MAVFPQKNGAARPYPIRSNRRFALGFAQHPLIHHGRSLVEANKLHQLDARLVRMFPRLPHSDLRRWAFWKVIYARRNRRERHALHLMLAGQLKTTPIARCKFFRLSAFPAVPYRPDRMEDPSGGKAKSWRRFGVAYVASGQNSANMKQIRPRGPVDRPIHTSSAKQGSVGSIDDSVRIPLCNISANYGEFCHAFPLSRIRHSEVAM